MSGAKTFDRLASKRVLILGATSGIGYAVAEATLGAGATVVVSSSNSGRIASTISSLETSFPSQKGQITGYKCDLGDDKTIESNLVQLLKDSTDNGANKLDHIILTAADPLAIKPLEDFDLEAMHNAGRIRFFAPLLLAKHAQHYVNPGRESSFTITSGGVADHPSPNWAIIGAYAAGHGGIVRGLALDLAPLRVNAVSPGFVNTEMWAPIMSSEAKNDLMKKISSKIPTGVVATATDIAESYLYLMKDYNATGSIVLTNSGHSLV